MKSLHETKGIKAALKGEEHVLESLAQAIVQENSGKLRAEMDQEFILSPTTDFTSNLEYFYFRPFFLALS